MAHNHKRKVDNLSRLMKYILGSKPDEFGLIPDEEGYIAIKELIKAINEEANMAYVRESYIKEVLLHDRDGMFEINGKNIRCTQRNYTQRNDEAHISPPKILYKGVKRKTYPSIGKYGLVPGSKEHVAMTKDRDLAIRIARRLDQKPIILEIKAEAAVAKGITFYAFGDSMYLAHRVPVEFISGPPLPKQSPPKKEIVDKERERTPGSFILTVEKDPDITRRKKAKKRIGWKEEEKKRRKRKGVRFKKGWPEKLF